MFEAFQSQTFQLSNGIQIHGVIGGSGPPLLLLHGFPQTHVCWHKVAPELTSRFTVVATDLRGYGASSKPEGGENHLNYSKRAIALDQLHVMQQLGFRRFSVAGHDRGGRVAHRLALDYPEAVERLAYCAYCDHVREHEPVLRRGLLPLVLLDPAFRSARTPDRCQCSLLPALDAQRVVARTSHLREVGRSVAQPGSALASGARGREFESPRSDQSDPGTRRRSEGLSGTAPRVDFRALSDLGAWTCSAQLFSNYIEGPWLPLWLPLLAHLGLEGVGSG